MTDHETEELLYLTLRLAVFCMSGFCLGMAFFWG